MEDAEFSRLDAKLDVAINGMTSLKTEIAVIRTALAGYDGQEGLIKKVEATCKRQEELEKDYGRLSRMVWILCAVSGAGLIGSGTSIFELIKVAAAR